MTSLLLMQSCALKNDRIQSEQFYDTASNQMAGRQYEKAVVSFEQSIEFNDKNPKSFAGLGWAHFSLLNFDQAKNNWEKAIEISPNSEAYSGIGHLALMKGNLKPAKKAFQSSIELDPMNSMAHQALGRVYIKEGLLDEAIIELKKSVEINPKDRFSYWLLSEIYKKKGLDEQSLKYRNKFTEP